MLVEFSEDVTTQVVEAASAAPSLHNTQPWQFDVASDELRLHGVADRALREADPGARALYISCGAALFNARVAAEVAGLDSEVWRLPHPGYPFDVLAVMRARERQSPDSAWRRLYDSIWARHTDRRPFSSRKIPAIVIKGLQKAAQAERAELRLLSRRDTSTVLNLAAEAGRALTADRAHQDELRKWLKDGAADGIPGWALPTPPQHSPSPVRDADFLGAATRVSRTHGAYERHPQIAVLSTDHDEPEDWLRAGEALQHVLLVATRNGLSASFLYQPIERDDMQDNGQRSWPWPEHPQMIIRLGYGSPTLPTPRRSSADTLGPPQRY